MPRLPELWGITVPTAGVRKSDNTNCTVRPRPSDLLVATLLPMVQKSWVGDEEEWTED